VTDPQDPFAAPGDQPPVPPPPPPPYGAPPPPPPAYGAPPPAYGAPPPAPSYGAPPQQGYGAMPQLAGWGSRVGAALIDSLCGFGIYIVPFLLGTAIGGALGGLLVFLGFLGALGFAIWNYAQQGTTGQTVGKKQVGLRLVREADGQFVGAGNSILRAIVHVVDGPCLLGYLWPLWDAKKQTFADKIMATLVIKA
jgi:uncharacterized RDD family membrane protein YckC